jgi:hypothetical protein
MMHVNENTCKSAAMAPLVAANVEVSSTKLSVGFGMLNYEIKFSNSCLILKGFVFKLPISV